MSGELRVIVDRSRCRGYANCLDAAPDAFDLDEHDIAVPRDDRFDESRRAELELAVRRCPAGALTLETVAAAAPGSTAPLLDDA